MTTILRELENVPVRLIPCPGCGRCSQVRFGVLEDHPKYVDRNGKPCPLMAPTATGQTKGGASGVRVR